MDELPKTAITKDVSYFAYRVFDYIWSLQKFFPLNREKDFAEIQSSRMSDDCKDKIYFTPQIGNAVHVTQLILHDYFKTFFHYDMYRNLESDFNHEFKSILLRWLKKRDNVFVKIIDSLAIISEAVWYCEHNGNFKLNLKTIAEWFTELFEENFAVDFFKKGGWGRLNDKAILWYSDMFKISNEVKKEFLTLDYMPTQHKCQFMRLLRQSTVMFPVPEDWFCENCWEPNDKQMTRQIVYVKPNINILKSLVNKTSIADNVSENKSLVHHTVTMKENVLFDVNTKLESIEKILERKSGDKIEYISDGTKCSIDHKNHASLEKGDSSLEKSDSSLEKSDSIFTSQGQSVKGSYMNSKLEPGRVFGDAMNSAIASSFTELHLTDSTEKMNRKLLNKFIGKDPIIEDIKDTEFSFITKEYNHSAENMFKEIFSIQSEKILKFSEFDQEPKYFDGIFSLIDVKCFNFKKHVSVWVGGKNIKSKSRREKQKSK